MADVFSSTKRSWVMRQIRSVDTAPELTVRRLLHTAGYRYRLHRGDLPGKPDLVFSRDRVALFVHGCFWHGHTCEDGRRPKSNTHYWDQKLDRNFERDRKNRAKLTELGWTPVVIWECEVKADPVSAIEKVTRLLTPTG